ncbi:MAG: hypothetical protein ACREYC_21070 [Gammaproteobacteria bacterium]
MTAPAGWSTALRELVTAPGAQLRRLVDFGFRSLPLLVLSWIPSLGLPAGRRLGAWSCHGSPPDALSGEQHATGG